MNASPRPNFRMSNDELLAAFRPIIRRHVFADLKDGARRMLADPDHMERVLAKRLYGPVPSSISSRLRACRARIAIELCQPSFVDPQRRKDLRAAMIALRWQRIVRRVEVVPMHEVEAA